MRILTITPTYNEAKNVVQLADELMVATESDLLVVDDSSPDGTGQVVRCLQARYPGRIHLIERPSKQGLGTAYVHAFGWALQQGNFDAVVQMDADGSHDPGMVPWLALGLLEADLVIGSRYVDGGSAPGQQPARKLLSRMANIYARGITRSVIRDMTGCFRAWSPSLLAKVEWDQMGGAGFSFVVESLVAAQRLGAKIVERPITYAPRRSGDSKMNSRIIVEGVSVVWGLR